MFHVKRGPRERAEYVTAKGDLEHSTNPVSGAAGREETGPEC